MSIHPLDLEQVSYSYLERPNRALLGLLRSRVLTVSPSAKILDVGCGCGANARAIRSQNRDVFIVGVEPDERACTLASEVCDQVFPGTVEAWSTATHDVAPFEAVLLSDVLEHVPDPVRWLRTLASRADLQGATWIISVPNYAVWYNRLKTLVGRFDYAWSGLYDRTHLRFYTRRSVRELLSYCGFELLDERCTASIVQSAAPLLRRRLHSRALAGDHLTLLQSPTFVMYSRFVEPPEEALCNLWPGLLGFQIVVAARLKSPGVKRSGRG